MHIDKIGIIIDRHVLLKIILILIQNYKNYFVHNLAFKVNNN